MSGPGITTGRGFQLALRLFVAIRKPLRKHYTLPATCSFRFSTSRMSWIDRSLSTAFVMS